MSRRLRNVSDYLVKIQRFKTNGEGKLREKRSTQIYVEKTPQYGVCVSLQYLVGVEEMVVSVIVRLFIAVSLKQLQHLLQYDRLQFEFWFHLYYLHVARESTTDFITIFIHQYMVDMPKIIIIQQTKNLNNLTKEMYVCNIQFVNNIFFQTVCIQCFSSAVVLLKT